MAKAKWKPMTDTDETLKIRLGRLKDKEMRLEADLAIKAHPELEKIIIKLAVSTAQANAVWAKITKMRHPTVEGQRNIDAMILRVIYLRGQLVTTEMQLKEMTDGKGNTQIDLKDHFMKEVDQLLEIYDECSGDIKAQGIVLRDILPSTADHAVIQ